MVEEKKVTMDGFNDQAIEVRRLLMDAAEQGLRDALRLDGEKSPQSVATLLAASTGAYLAAKPTVVLVSDEMGEKPVDLELKPVSQGPNRISCSNCRSGGPRQLPSDPPGLLTCMHCNAKTDTRVSPAAEAKSVFEQTLEEMAAKTAAERAPMAAKREALDGLASSRAPNVVTREANGFTGRETQPLEPKYDLHEGARDGRTTAEQINDALRMGSKTFYEIQGLLPRIHPALLREALEAVVAKRLIRLT